MISTQQKAIIRQICQIQKESYLRLTQEAEGIHGELLKEGYEVTLSEVLEILTDNFLQWEGVEEEPEKFLRILDDSNISLVKHHLVNEFLLHDDARPIWKQLNLFDRVNEFRN